MMDAESSNPADPVETLLAAYRLGYFPMANPDGRGSRAGEILWFNPDPRGIPSRDRAGPQPVVCISQDDCGTASDRDGS